MPFRWRRNCGGRWGGTFKSPRLKNPTFSRLSFGSWTIPRPWRRLSPNGDVARKIVVLCLDSLENTLFREKGAGKAAHAC